MIPQTWSSVEIEDCLTPYPNGKKIRQGWSPQCEDHPAQTNDDWAVLRTSAIQDGRFVEVENKKLPKSLEPRTHLQVEPGDILLTCAGPRSRCGVACLVRATRPRLLISGKMYQLRADSEIIERHFLELFLRESGTQKKIDEMKTGISDSGLNLTHDRFRALTIPLPPLAEQKRIVAKIEELFSELDSGEESLRVARRQLGVYRQSLLKQAFEGRLTARWRSENPDKLESPAALLGRIQSARQSRHKNQETRGQTSYDGIKLAKIKEAKPVAPFTPEEHDSFPTLPTCWARDKLGRLFRIVSGQTPKEISHKEDGMVPYYRVSDMNTHGNELRMRSSSTWLKGCQAEELGLHIYPEGTVIFPKRGGAILTNKKRVLTRPSCFDLNTMGVINDEPSIDSEFLRWWFMKLDLSKIYDGSNIPQINNKNVEHLPFELPSLPEQQEIVRLLDEQFEVIERNEREIDAALKRSEALRQSILKKAFTGWLVPQDPADEPAAALLARIRAERDGSPVARKSPGRARRAATPGA